MQLQILFIQIIFSLIAKLIKEKIGITHFFATDNLDYIA